MDWLDALPLWLSREPAVILITIAATRGSAPRDAGTAMLVSATATMGTIGGGHLEWETIARARGMLADGPGLRAERFALGPSLNQCCGGIVHLLMERIPGKSVRAWADRRAVVREGARLRRQVGASDTASRWDLLPPEPARSSRQFEEVGNQWLYTEEIVSHPFAVTVFGAGHVGRALVAALHPLGANVDWVDTRTDGFPNPLPDDIRIHRTDEPERLVDAAPPDSFLVIATHSHALDFSLCTRAFRRRDFAYLGLIGSNTKRALFENRLRNQGLEKERLAELICPIGVPGIRSKDPAAIAIAVAAQILQVREARERPHIAETTNSHAKG